MAVPLESVPNFSEGRDRTTLDAIAAAIERSARVLDVHADAAHNRSVFTCVGSPEGLVDGLAAAVEVAVERIDLTRHEGVHPRVGAADVVPLVRFADGDRRPLEAARRLGERLGALGLPVLGYGELSEDGCRPASYRRGGLDELARRLADGEVEPLFGPHRLHPTAGAVLVGVRAPLVAFNVELATDDLAVARAVAARVRASGGGLPGVQALGLFLADRGVAQVSTNLIDIGATPLWRLVAEIERAAAEHGVAVTGSELVGLVPAGVAAAAAAHALRLPRLRPDAILEVAAGTRLDGGP